MTWLGTAFGTLSGSSGSSTRSSGSTLSSVVAENVRAGMSEVEGRRMARSAGIRRDRASEGRLSRCRGVHASVILDNSAPQDLRCAGLPQSPLEPGIHSVATSPSSHTRRASEPIPPIFSLIDTLMLKYLPVSHPEELLQVGHGGYFGWFFTNPLWEALRDRQQVFSGVFAFRSGAI